MTWDVIVTDTQAVSHLPTTSSTAAAAAEGAADFKELPPTLSFRWLSKRSDPSFKALDSGQFI